MALVSKPLTLALIRIRLAMAALVFACISAQIMAQAHVHAALELHAECIQCALGDRVDASLPSTGANLGYWATADLQQVCAPSLVLASTRFSPASPRAPPTLRQTTVL